MTCPTSLESLARAAYAAWDRWVAADAPAVDLHDAMQALGCHLAAPTPPRAGAYMTPGDRVQVELRFACALIAGCGWPAGDHNGDKALIDHARRLAHLLLDGPEKE